MNKLNHTNKILSIHKLAPVIILAGILLLLPTLFIINNTAQPGVLASDSNTEDTCSSVGDTQCYDSSNYQICGDYDSDPYLEWSSKYPCNDDEVCSGGSCVEDSSCSDQCGTVGEQKCSSDNSGYHICGDYDSDECLDWSSEYPCNDGETCSSGSCEDNCSSQAYESCYDNDLYWYDSCDQRGSKKEECGSDSWTDEYRCSNDWVQRKKHKQGCSYTSCYDYYNWENHEDCADQGKTCSNGECVSGNQAPTADFSFSPSNPSTNDTIQFTDASSDSDGSISSYSWNFGDGHSSTQENPTHSYSSQGSYTVQLTVEDDDGSTDTYSKGVSVGSSCTSQAYESCYDNDLYWYDSCDQRGSKKEECDSDSWTDEYRCSNDWVQRKKHKQGCSYTSCYDYYNWENHEDCADQGKTCSNGECVPSNADECSPSGKKECADNNSYRTCKDIDSDSYLEWSQSYSCEDNETCSDGECVPADECNDECSHYGQDECSGNNAYRTCGDYDSDDCLEWSSTKSCEGSNTCGYSRCDNDERPDWYCSGGDCRYECDYDSSCEGEEHNYLKCFNDDVYWYDSRDDREEKYRECGADYCENWSEDYCEDGEVYKKRTCYNKGCSRSSCYSSTYPERDLVENCDSDEVCQSGECIEAKECTSGPCCEGGEIKSSNAACDIKTKTQYGAPWGRRCGADLAKRDKTKLKHCSGHSSSCTGKWEDWGDWSAWTLAEDCSSNETPSVVKEECQYNSSCTTNDNYVSCYNDDLYWYNQQNTRLSKYRNCEDKNSCTKDSCSGNSCEHELICDGSTCEVGSEDYCNECTHCGDGTCNCEETSCSCPEDCATQGLVISLSGKESRETTDWQKDLLVNSDQKVDFLVTVTNSGSDSIEDVDLTADLTNSISYLDDIKSEGKSITGDITRGITIDQLRPETTQTYTFKAKTENLSEQKQVTVTAEANSDNRSDKDSVKVKIKKTAALSAAPLLAALQSITRVWYGWPLVIIILIIIWLGLSRIVGRWGRD